MKNLFYYRDKYVRSQPSAFCPGCGGGIILNCFLRAIDDLGLDQDKILAVHRWDTGEPGDSVIVLVNMANKR